MRVRAGGNMAFKGSESRRRTVSRSGGPREHEGAAADPTGFGVQAKGQLLLKATGCFWRV